MRISNIYYSLCASKLIPEGEKDPSRCYSSAPKGFFYECTSKEKGLIENKKRKGANRVARP